MVGIITACFSQCIARETFDDSSEIVVEEDGSLASRKQTRKLQRSSLSFWFVHEFGNIVVMKTQFRRRNRFISF